MDPSERPPTPPVGIPPRDPARAGPAEPQDTMPEPRGDPGIEPGPAPRRPPPDGPPTQPAGVPSPPDVPAFLLGWGRYQVLSQLGAGGMGEVYRAWDPRLQRWVALKFLHGSDPLRLARFQREAQAQARVDHPGVCRVYEVGEVEGRPYIAMQEIAGATLDRAAREVPLEERVRLVAQVADAVHAAHRIGLIHRDLKPRNILVAWGDDGLHPFVVDFGLARDLRISGLSVSGALSGTPGYMAPEQARGEDAALDRRADVYSLGAVLYELVAGTLPHPAANVAEAFVKLLQNEPVPLRQAAPSVPGDLETVVMKCLERDPARRYESSRALAADLRRWLDGEPVEARRASWLYRLRKRVARHPQVAAASLVAALVIVALAGAAVRARWEAAARAEAARRFGTVAKEMEAVLRAGQLAPAHDTRAERAAVRRLMARVERDMQGLGRGARGAGLYALGRGALALGDSREALGRLEGAWAAGERGPEVSEALGQALGQRYFEGLERLSGGRQAAADAPLRNELERRFRDPAREQLRRAAAVQGAFDAPELVEARLALYEGRYTAARQAAARALVGRPWLHEARHVQAVAWRREGIAADERGDVDGALAAFAHALEANAAAMAIARSGAPAHAEECARQQTELRVLRQRRPIEEAEVARAVASCERALTLDPELVAAYGELGRVLNTYADDLLRQGKDPHAAVARAIQAIDRQIAFDPKSDDAWAALGSSHMVLARWDWLRGDPKGHLERSAAAYRTAIQLEPRRPSSHNGLANALAMTARYREMRGLDAESARRGAIAAFERAIALWNDYAIAYGNLGATWVDVASHELAAGHDPRPALRRAIEIFDRGLSVNAANPSYLNNSGNAALTLAEYQVQTGEDPRAALDDARARFRSALALRPQYAIPHWNLAYVSRLEALRAMRAGGDPGPSLSAARSSIERAREIDPTDPDMPLEAARIEVAAARWAVRQGRDPRQALERAANQIALGLAANSENADFHLVGADRWRWEAVWITRHGGNAEPAIARGLAEVARALAVNPEMADALAMRVALLRLRGDDAGAGVALAAARRLNPRIAVEQ